MGAIKSTLALNDGMSAVLRRINKAMSLTLDTFEAVQRASGQTFNTANISAARQELGLSNAALDEMEQHYRNCNTQQTKLNKKIREGASCAGGLMSKIKGVAAAYLGKKGIDWVQESLSLFDTQHGAETQLKTVLNNMGASPDASAYLKEKAGALQSKTTFGDEALLGGAAEFATYMSDEKAIGVMMETLTNYATGMGGVDVGYKEMVDYATGLGKIMTGSYDAMTKKGFEFTKQQKKIIENGTDMEKALVISDVVNESWANLAVQMANTPEGKIIQLKNAFGDMREELAQKIYPSVMLLFDTIGQNTGNLKGLIVGLAQPINLITVLTTKLVNGLSKVYTFVTKNWGKIGPIVYGIAGAFAAYNTALLIHKAYLLGAAIVQGIKTVAEYANAKATLKAAEAAGVNTAALESEASAAALAAAALTAEQVAEAGATVAQGAFNTALWACPVTWIIAAIILLIVLFVMFTEQIVGAIWWCGALFKNVGLWLANLGIAIGMFFKNVGLWIANLAIAIAMFFKNIGLWCANLGLAIWQVIKNIGLWFGNLGLSVWAVIKNVGLWFANLGLGIWSTLKACAGNVKAAFVNTWQTITAKFWAFVAAVQSGVLKVANLCNNLLGVFGITIDTSGLEAGIQNAKSKAEAANSDKLDYQDLSAAWSEGFNTFAYDSISDAWNTFDYGSVGDAFDTFDIDWGDVGAGFNTFEIDFGEVADGFGTFDTFQSGWASTAYNNGAAIGANIKSWMNDNLSINGLLNKLGFDPDAYDFEGGGDENDYSDTLDDIAGNTSKTAKNSDKTKEELSYLRDIAEKDAVNRFTTAEVKIDMTGMTNRIDSDMNIDGVVELLTDEFVEALETAAEGVY